MTPSDVPVLRNLAAVEAELTADKPVLFLIWHDRSPRRDAEIALKEAQNKYPRKLRAFIVDARDDPGLAERFDLGANPVLIGWYNGEEHTRRSRPWNTDVTGIADEMAALAAVPANGAAPEEQEEEPETANDKPVHVTTDNFKQLIIDSPIPVIVDFWAEWCQPCKMVAPILEKLAKEFAGQVRIAKIDVDANQALAGQFGIQSIPTLMFVKNGKIVGQSAGAAPEPALRDVIQQLIELQV
jgi:thioredoxin 1